jgi:hypothetical protein
MSPISWTSQSGAVESSSVPTYETTRKAPEYDGDWHGKDVSYPVAKIQQYDKITSKAQHQRQDVDQIAPV